MKGVGTRGGRAGMDMAKSIIEMVHLFYQNKTALAFLKSLAFHLNEEIKRRERGK